MNERILALDIGDARIGIAVSDERRVISQPVEVYQRVGYGPDTRHIQELCRRYDTTLVLSGLPLNMDGTLGGQAEKVKALCQQLENAGLTVIFQDERLTTVAAEKALLEGGMSRKGRKGTVDKVAAAVILQQWLDRGARPDSTAGSINGQPISTTNRNEDEIMDENNGNIIELVDEDGESVEFEHLMTLEHEGEYYIVLMAVEDDEDNDEGEVLILKVEKDEKGEDCYVTVDDDNVTQAVFDKFIAAIEEDDDEIPESVDGEEGEEQ